MNVAELITKLNEFDSKTKVYVYEWDATDEDYLEYEAQTVTFYQGKLIIDWE